MFLEQDQDFSAQEWPLEPGERRVQMWVDEPSSGPDCNTGLMLVLHGWGGTYREDTYTAFCRFAADRYNVIAVSVNYLQSGAEWVERCDKPYDHGLLQAMDCIGALYTVRKQLLTIGVPFSEKRIYSVGGSGGGNCTQMALKLAPHTFACGVDKCGMPGLTDSIAYGTGEYGSHLDAKYSRCPGTANYLTHDMQEIRDFGNAQHCKLLHEANPDLQIVIIHAMGDCVCPVVPKIMQFHNIVQAGIMVDGRFLSEYDIDGDAVEDIGHSIGPWCKLIPKFADDYLLENGRLAKATSGNNDFMRCGTVEYPTTNGRYIVDYRGYPFIEFVPTD